MNKSDLVPLVAEAASITNAQAKAAIDSVFSNIANTMTGGYKVSIADFGVFKPVAVAARTARNPRTGETINVPAKTKYSFKASTSLR